MTTRMECFLSDKWPADSPVRLAAVALGFAKSGFVPPKEYFNRQTGYVEMTDLFQVFDDLDSSISPWVPLCLNCEHVSWYLKNDGALSSRGFVAMQTHVVAAMKERYLRLISAWGQPYNIHPDEAEASRLYTCAAISAYWKEGQTTGEWFYNSRERHQQASPIIAEQDMDEMLYVSPTVFPKVRGDPGVTMNNGQWNHVLNYCEEVRVLNPRAMFCFWQNRLETGFTDSYLVDRLQSMKQRLE